jgi:hypothetical protein
MKYLKRKRGRSVNTVPCQASENSHAIFAAIVLIGLALGAAILSSSDTRSGDAPISRPPFHAQQGKFY